VALFTVIYVGNTAQLRTKTYIDKIPLVLTIYSTTEIICVPFHSDNNIVHLPSTTARGHT